MAVVGLICGGCGKPLAPEAPVCPSCGEAAEFPPGLEVRGMIACELCGVGNPADSRTCRACGAKLPRGGKEAKGGKDGGRREPRRQAPGRGPSPRRALEPWQIISGLAVVSLLGYLGYSEWPRGERVPASATQSAAPLQTLLPDLAPLENAVAANPKDPGALLRLANALHDGRQFARATDLYGRYLALVPDDPDARVDLGTCYYEMALNDSANAESLFRRAVVEMETAARKTPTHQPAAYNLGIVNLAMRNAVESMRWFQRARDIDQSSALGKKAQMLLDQHRQFTSPQ